MTNKLTMKKTCLFLMLLLLATTMVGQITRVRAYSCATAEYDALKKDFVWAENKDCSILGIIGDYTINIYAKQTLSLSKIASDSTRMINGVQCTSYQCVDNEGIACGTTICINRNRKFTIFVKYADYIFAYYCTEETL